LRAIETANQVIARPAEGGNALFPPKQDPAPRMKAFPRKRKKLNKALKERFFDQIAGPLLKVLLKEAGATRPRKKENRRKEGLNLQHNASLTSREQFRGEEPPKEWVFEQAVQAWKKGLVFFQGFLGKGGRPRRGRPIGKKKIGEAAYLSFSSFVP